MIDLNNYMCTHGKQYYSKWYDKILNELSDGKTFMKKKEAIIFSGPPGSGKSTLAKKYKTHLNIEFDDIMRRLPNVMELEEKGVLVGDNLYGCDILVSEFIDDLLINCTQNSIPVLLHYFSGTPEVILRYLKTFDYRIITIYVYSDDSIQRAAERKYMKFSNQVYQGILESMSGEEFFTQYLASDQIKLVNTDKLRLKQIIIKKNSPDAWLEFKTFINTHNERLMEQLRK